MSAEHAGRFVWPEQLSLDRLLTRPWVSKTANVDASIADALDEIEDNAFGVTCPECERIGDYCERCLNAALRDAVSIG